MRRLQDNGVPDECVGGITGDADSDHADLGALLGAWGSQPGDPHWNENADLDGNAHIGHGDLGVLLADWGCDDPVNGCVGDLNGDDKTDQADLGILLADWGCGT